MKTVVAIAVGALAIGLPLSGVVYYFFGANPGYFFAKFMAAPVGFVCAFVLFIAYDALLPENNARN